MAARVLRKGLGRGSPKSFRFLDVGFGNAERIANYARKKRSKLRLFYGVEQEKQRTLVPSRQKNVKLMYGDVQAKLKKMPSNSLNAVNMDFFPLTAQRIRPNGFTAQGLPRFEATTQVLFPKLMGEIRRVLGKNGRLYLTVPAGAVSEMDAILYENGFKEMHFFNVPESQKNATQAMREHFKLAQTDPSARPVRMVVAKRVKP